MKEALLKHAIYLVSVNQNFIYFLHYRVKCSVYRSKVRLPPDGG